MRINGARPCVLCLQCALLGMAVPPVRHAPWAPTLLVARPMPVLTAQRARSPETLAPSCPLIVQVGCMMLAVGCGAVRSHLLVPSSFLGKAHFLQGMGAPDGRTEWEPWRQQAVRLSAVLDPGACSRQQQPYSWHTPPARVLSTHSIHPFTIGSTLTAWLALLLRHTGHLRSWPAPPNWAV